MQDRQRERFSADELAVVLSRYDLGPIESITEFQRGSRRRPKVGIVSKRGKFLLKRRTRAEAASARLAYSHRLQQHLSQVGFTLPTLIPVDTDGELVLQRGGYVYELFEFVRGQSYDGSGQQTQSSGRTLAAFHQAVASFPNPESPHHGDYHDCNPVMTALTTLPGAMSSHDSAMGLESELIDLSVDLVEPYERCCKITNDLGLRTWPCSVIHADWHPGNMLFRHQKVVAVVDYDAARSGQPVIDTANGLLQFSMLSAKHIENWPDEIDLPRARLFVEGYVSLQPLTPEERMALPHLMIEALVAESVLPVAATGSFGRYQGVRFLNMVRRKVAWMEQHADELADCIAAAATP